MYCTDLSLCHYNFMQEMVSMQRGGYLIFLHVFIASLESCFVLLTLLAICTLLNFYCTVFFSSVIRRLFVLWYLLLFFMIFYLTHLELIRGAFPVQQNNSLRDFWVSIHSKCYSACSELPVAIRCFHLCNLNVSDIHWFIFLFCVFQKDQI